MSTWLASVTAVNVPHILMAAGLLVVAVVVLSVGVWYYRRRWFATSDAGGFPWTLDDLRAMRKRGDLTEQEYQALRANLIGFATAQEQDETGAPEAGAVRTVPGSNKNGSDRGLRGDPSGDTVWRFDLKKSPPG